MKKITYSKFNRERLPAFQLGTIHFIEDEVKKVEKRPLTQEAEMHIDTMLQNTTLLNEIHSNVNVLVGEKKNRSLVYPYIEGISWDKHLFEQFKAGNLDGFHQTIKEYWNMLLGLQTGEETTFSADEKFQKVFGKKLEMGFERCLQPANIDLIFENIIIDESGTKNIIDCEWVFDFKIPIKFIFFRGVYSFWIKYQADLDSKVSLKELLAPYEITEANLVDFLEMEEKYFQNYVNGKDYLVGFHGNYMKPSYPVNHLYQTAMGQMFNVKLFYENNGQYDEDHCMVWTGIASGQVQTYSFQVSKEMLFSEMPLRLDPFDRSGFAKIKSLKIYNSCNEDRKLFFKESSFHNLFNYNEQVNIVQNNQEIFLFSIEEDPQLFLKPLHSLVNSLDSTFFIEIEMQVELVSSKFIEDLCVMYSDKIEKVEQQMRSATSEAEEKVKKLIALDKKLKEKTNKIEEKEKDLKEKQKEVEQLTAVLNTSRATLNQVLNSKSWKFTEPLRKLMSVFSKRKM
ncbi:hypothetical protein [Saccharibacillus kuerlensis]|uniref:Uncharacterized protein n=1 Tax=Saccharibacillus kuerlensis TaxID=459527 RepID=A0ABQ2KTM2_9BACL|nr:hypothetical protein [Saccharibacillus kuerlensis]GGN92951.1 hypothetical protein GCM10010969_06000 [Saccharibacillus kuerlensis]